MAVSDETVCGVIEVAVVVGATKVVESSDDVNPALGCNPHAEFGVISDVDERRKRCVV